MLVISFALLMPYVNSYHTILYTMILKGRTFYRNTIYVDSTKVFDIRDMIVLYISVVHLFGWRKLCVLQKSSHHRILSQKVFCLNAKHTSSRKSPNWAYNKLCDFCFKESEDRQFPYELVYPLCLVQYKLYYFSR